MDIIYNNEKNIWKMNLMYNIDDYYTYNILIKSDVFCGEYHFCLNKTDIIHNNIKLHTIYNNMHNTSEIIKFIDTDSDAYISVETNANYVKVFGQIGSVVDENYLIFSFFADQT